MRMLKSIAVLMVFLVVSMPISFAAQYGIVSYKISGRDGVNKVVKDSDVLSVEVIANIQNDPEITPDQVYLGSSIPFDTCVPDVSGTLCRLTFPKDGEREFSNKEPFVITLHDDTHSTPPKSYSRVDEVYGTFTIDTYPPRLQLSGLKGADSLNIQVNAVDDSFAIGQNEECAGLKTVQFTTPGGEVQYVKDYADSNICVDSSTEAVDVSGVAEGTYPLNVVVEDYAGNSANYNYDVIVDRTGPQFSNARIVDMRGDPVTHIGNAVLEARVIVDTDDDIASVYGDLSLLNDKVDYSNLAGSCADGECSFNVQIVPTAYGAKTLTFSAEDDIGNPSLQQLSINIARDVDGPRALELRTATRGSNGENYINSVGNTIEVLFTESGIGLNEEDVKLDLSAMGGGNSIRATSCTQGWTCTWENLDFSLPDGVYPVAVTPSTQDRLGNTLKEPFTGEVIMDTSQPVVVSVEVDTIHGGLSNYEGFTTYGDSLEVTANVFEPGTITDAYADFSAFISGANLVQADDCREINSSLWECKWLSNAIDKTGFIEADIGLTFQDFLGNSVDASKQVTVIGIEDTLADLWTHTVSCSPSKIDRQVASLVEQKVYCHVKLGGGAYVVKMDMEECNGTASQYVRRSELINNVQGTTDPYIRLTLHTAEIPEDEMTLSCPIAIISKNGNVINSLPEIENVEFTVPFYNNPLGEYTENLEKKAEDAVSDATGGVWDLITSLQTIMFYAERICGLISTINNVATLINSVSVIIDKWSKALLPWNPGAAKELDLGRQEGQSVAGSLNQKMKWDWIGGSEGILGGSKDNPEGGFINKFCKFISCRLYYDEWGDNILGEAGTGIADWQRGVMTYANDFATGYGAGEFLGLGGQGINAYSVNKGQQSRISSTKTIQGGRLDPKDSIVLSFLTLCIPGIIYNLDKYRQIQCMYADCMQTSVDTGVPVYACEEAKEHETCKYVYGEIFQLMPFTGLLNYFSGLVKGALSSPFGFIDITLGYMCQAPISTPFGGQIASLCLWQEVAGMIADVWSDLANIKDDWKIKNDYCSRLDEEDNGGGGGFLGL